MIRPWPPSPPRIPTCSCACAALALELAVAALYAVATLGFLRCSWRLGDEFFGWLAIAAVLAARRTSTTCCIRRSTLSPFTPAICSALLLRRAPSSARCGRSGHTGTLFRRRRSLEERQRIACDLHDGLAQELAYLARNLDALTRGRRRGSAQPACGGPSSARNWNPGGRSARWPPPAASPFEVALADAAAEVAERFHVGLDLDITSGRPAVGRAPRRHSCGSPARPSPTPPAIAGPAR